MRFAVLLLLIGLTGCASNSSQVHQLQQSVQQLQQQLDELQQDLHHTASHRNTGLDPQGHLEAGYHPHEKPCADQYEYDIFDVYYDYSTNPPQLVIEKIPLFCWGEVQK